MPLATRAQHTVHASSVHLGWDRSIEPVLRVAPGAVIELAPLDASCGQLGPGSSAADVASLDFTKVNPLAGPVYVEGAEPGDALLVTLLEFAPSGWGWTANIPGFGLLADQFPEPALAIWKYDPHTLAPALFGPGARVPLKPFCGTIGVAPAEPGLHSVVPPRRVGGNMDIRDLGAGSQLWLPVEVPGALFSLGDPHAGQGDGEVCGTAIESPLGAAVKLELRKGEAPRFPRFTTPGPVTRHLDTQGYEVTTGVGPDLMQGARAAVSEMIELLARRHRLAPIDAYLLCSACADLRISELVDAPNWIVSLYFPRSVLA